jgi:hypothetical protein
MEVKLVGDGTLHGFKLVDAKSGELINGIESFSYGMKASDAMPRLEVVFINPLVELAPTKKNEGAAY